MSNDAKLTRAELEALTEETERALAGRFAEIDRTAYANTGRILRAFREEKVSDSCFAGTTGYGYDDKGREVLDAVWSRVFETELSLVRHNFGNGRHGLSTALFGLLRPGETLVGVTGKPYDTLDEVIGISGANGDGSLADFGIKYAEIPMAGGISGGRIDIPAVRERLLQDSGIRVVFVQRSKGYMNRRTLSPDEITELTEAVHSVRRDVMVVVDNCYGEFTADREPKADLLVGSLIKNPGGGMALTGGYITGTARAVELCSYRLTTVGTGREVGATLGQNRNMFMGLFYAPHTTAQAIKTAHFAAYVFEKLGYDVFPAWDEPRFDIIQTVITHSRERLCDFCRGIQSGSPVDSYVSPEPWAMPGYTDEVIMAAGCFVQGASVEMSADGPIRPPYTAFFQGGLTYESGKYGVLEAAAMVGRNKD
ncbi:MAG: methionine gamma-lyase family protein [Clostridia bacterium]|nr:methionine gamma-lyase family protein [Clostridia bacterium]